MWFLLSAIKKTGLAHNPQLQAGHNWNDHIHGLSARSGQQTKSKGLHMDPGYTFQIRFDKNHFKFKFLCERWISVNSWCKQWRRLRANPSIYGEPTDLQIALPALLCLYGRDGVTDQLGLSKSNTDNGIDGNSGSYPGHRPQEAIDILAVETVGWDF